MFAIFFKNDPQKTNILLEKSEKDYENKEETSMFTDKRKSITVDYNNMHSQENIFRLTTANRRKSDVSHISGNHLFDVTENISSEKSFSSEKQPTTPVHTISSKAVSNISEFENVDYIAVRAYSKNSRKNREQIVNF